LFVSIADIPTVVIGPGSIVQAHKPDEYVELSELANCAGFIERLTVYCSDHPDLGDAEDRSRGGGA
jgi:acetylornithine deacetylase